MATVVTAFYSLDKSKHGVDKYHEWLQNFCAIPCNLVVFTDTTTVPLIRAARGDRPTVIHERPFDAWDMTTPAMMEMWRRQLDRDPEKAIHSPELYAVWAIKQEAIMSIITENPYQSRWFIWCDIGIQRHGQQQPWYMPFPNVEVCEHLIAPGRMTFLEVRPIPHGIVDHWARDSEYTGPVPSITLGGGCIAGDAAAWSDFSEAYKEELKRFDAAGQFNGKDQIVFFMMLINRRVKHPYRLIHAQPFGSGGDPWMCFPVILGGKTRSLIDKRFETV